MDTILSIAYLPNIEYMSHLIKDGNINIEICESYKKQTFRNRCHILTANGILPLIIPVKKINGNNTRTSDIEISYDTQWQRNHWRAITSAYGSSPFFIYYKDKFEQFYNTSITKLIDFNFQILITILDILHCKKQIQFTEKFELNSSKKDLRYNITTEKAFIIDNERFHEYHQVYSSKFGFCNNLSIIDLIFNMGPESKVYLEKLNL